MMLRHLSGDHEIVVLCVQKLHRRLEEMESELNSVREAACGQERTMQTLSDSLNTKDCEVCLYLKLKVVTGVLCISHRLCCTQLKN